LKLKQGEAKIGVSPLQLLTPYFRRNPDEGAALVNLEYYPVTRERAADLARFSEQHGKFRYCSCMRWRLTSVEFQRSTKESRVAALERLVDQGTPVGVLAYQDGEPVGWCSIAPRDTYGALERFRALPRLDDVPVWSVVCFFVDRRVRREGVTLGLLQAAVAYARSKGAAVVEGYPVEPGPRLYTYMGSPSTFQRAGFRDVTPPGQTRPVMRHINRSESHDTPGVSRTSAFREDPDT
jgi:GNAT superfamily N-acetyltransferase